MTGFSEARDALLRAIRKVFPDARPAKGWAGVETWAAPRPPQAVFDASGGTYDPTVITIGIADRKSGPVVYFLDPGDYFALETNRALLEGAGLKVGRGCIYHTRKAPLPVDALETLFQRAKSRDLAAGAKRKAPAKRMASPATVDEYLASLAGPQRLALGRLRKLVRAAAPEAVETMSYGMPTFRLEGNLVHMAAFKEHCSFFPGRAGIADLLASELEGFETAKGTIRFPPNRPLPAALVQRIVKMRVAENQAQAAKRKAAKATARKAQSGAAKPRAKKAAPRRARTRG